MTTADRYIVKAVIEGDWQYLAGSDANDWTADPAKAATWPLNLAERKVRYFKKAGFHQCRYAAAE